MSHTRKLIRDRAVENLTGLSTTGSNVFKSRVYPLKPGKLPGLLVYAADEESEIIAAGGLLGRDLVLIIQGYIKAVGGIIDDTADSIADEVEEAIDSDRKFNGLALNSYLESTEIELSGEGDKPVGIITLKFLVTYTTAGFLQTEADENIIL